MVTTIGENYSSTKKDGGGNRQPNIGRLGRNIIKVFFHDT
jgi:hypothetical protein